MRVALACAAIFSICLLVLNPDRCEAQDLETKVRQQQELVRERMEETRARMAQHRAEMQNQSKQYVQTYGSQTSLPQATTSCPNQSSSRPAASSYPNQSSSRPATSSYANSSYNRYSNQQSYAAQAAVPPGVEWPPRVPDLPPLPPALHTVKKQKVSTSNAHKHSALVESHRSSGSSSQQSGLDAGKGQGKELDSMQETGPSTERNPARIGNTIWLAWLKGGIVGAAYGLIASCMVVILLQLVRLRGISPTRYSSYAAAAIMVMTTGGVSRINSSQVYDSWAKRFPFLGSLLPPSTPANVTHTQAAPPMTAFHSASFLCDVQIPEPISLQRKLINNMWTTSATYQTEDGVLVMSYTKMSSPEEMLKQQRANNPFAGPAPVPGTVYFDVEKGLDGALKGSVDEMHGKAAYTTRITCGQCSGREAAGSIPDHDGKFKERMFIGNGNLYVVATIGKEPWVNSKMSQQFLDSFHIR